MNETMMAIIQRGREWVRKTTEYKTEVNLQKDRSLRGKARRKARRNGRR